MKNSTMAVLAAVTALAFATPATAQQFFGEDTNGSESTQSTNVNGLTQENLFLANLQGVGTESFEGFAEGSTVPLGLSFPGAGSATLSGGGGEVEDYSGRTNGVSFGRYAIDGTNFFETALGGSNPFTITFLNPVAAFGFYGVDIGDFGSQLSLAFANGGGTTNVLVPHEVGSSGSTGGNSFFFGYIDVLNPFTSITFNGTTSADVFAFDRMTIGSVEQVVSVPEPGLLLLLGVGTVGMLLVARRREGLFDA